MIRKRLGRFATVLTAASMALALLGVGTVAAKNPTWSITAVKLPASVTAGRDAGYAVTVRNAGPSNVNALTLTVSPPADAAVAPSYFSGLTWNTGGPGSCTSTGKLVCDLGTMVGGATITFTVAYTVPAAAKGTFDVVFTLESASGNTGKDGGNSRGDKLNVTSKTTIGSGANFDGGFTLDSTSFATTGSLGRNNKQTTALDTTDLHIPVTVTDGIDSFPCSACTTNTVGEWSILDVNNGNSGPIKVTIMVWGGTVPGGVSASDLYLIHADGSGGFHLVDQLCDATHSNADCLAGTPVKVGNNYKITAWLSHNGGLRGGF